MALYITVKKYEARLMHLPLIGDLISFFLPSCPKELFLILKSKLNKSNFTRIYLDANHSGSVSLSHGMSCVPFHYMDLSLLVPLKMEFEIPYLFSLSSSYSDEIGNSFVSFILDKESSFTNIK